MTNYLDVLSNKTINESTSPERSEKTPYGVVRILNINVSFFKDFIDIVESFAKQENYESLLKQINNLNCYDLSYHEQKLFKIVRVEKAYLFYSDIVQHIYDKKWPDYNLKKLEQLDSNKYRLSYGKLSYTFITDKRELGETEKSSYNYEKSSFVLFPLFLEPISKSKTYVEHTGIGTLATKLIAYKDDSKCPCLSNVTDSYESCCKPHIVVSDADRIPSYFGFHLVEVTKEVDFKRHIKPPTIDTSLLLRQINNKKMKLQKQLNSILNTIPIPDVRSSILPEDVKKTLLSIDEQLHAIGFRNILWIIKDIRGTPVKSVFSEQEKWEQIEDIIRIVHYEHFALAVAEVMQKVIERFESPDITQVIHSWQVLPEHSEQAILDSLDLYRQGKYHSASILLVSQIEVLLRELLVHAENMQVPITAISAKNINTVTYKTLKVIIEDFYSHELFENANGQAVKYLLMNLLTQNGQFHNLRNELLHGFELKKASQKDFLVILFLFFLINKPFI